MSFKLEIFLIREWEPVKEQYGNPDPWQSLPRGHFIVVTREIVSKNEQGTFWSPKLEVEGSGHLGPDPNPHKLALIEGRPESKISNFW